MTTMSFIARAWSRIGRQGSKPRALTNSNFTRIPPNEIIEEEGLPDYLPQRYYPVRIGEVFVDRYQVVGKLGYGATSTVWLAHDLNKRRHVALKVFIRSQALGDDVRNEISMFKRIDERPSAHPGRDAVRQLLDSFEVKGPDGDHLILAHEPLWRSVEALIVGSKQRRLPASGVRFVLRDIFEALDYLHNECQIIHTDIKTDNIMVRIGDDSVLAEFEEDELKNPSPRKELEDRSIYLSRKMRAPGTVGHPVLCDFGSAIFSDDGTEHREIVQPHVYRAPEVTLQAAWDNKIDIWSVGCMAWEMLESTRLFNGIDSEHKAYRRRAHLAEIITLLGPPPQDLLARGNWSKKFFSEDGKYVAGLELPDPVSLSEVEHILKDSDDKRLFLAFMDKMLQWDPAERSTAAELYNDAWLQKPMVQEQP